MNWLDRFPQTRASFVRLRTAWTDLQRAKADLRFAKAVAKAMGRIPHHWHPDLRCDAAAALLLAVRSSEYARAGFAPTPSIPGDRP